MYYGVCKHHNVLYQVNSYVYKDIHLTHYLLAVIQCIYSYILANVIDTVLLHLQV